MTTIQFKTALRMAVDNSVDLSTEELNHFDGFGLQDFRPVYCTIQQIARLIRWQAIQFNGEVNQETLTEVARFGKKRFMVMD
jgi:hypothetical protein